MFKVVLVPVDVANLGAAPTVLALARELSKQQDGKVILLNVVEVLPKHIAALIPDGIPGNVHNEVVSHAESTLAQLAEDHELPSGTEVLVRDGHAPTTVLEVAKETQADVIIIASHDPGIAHFLLGSVAARVVRHAHCSVLVARNVTP